MSNLLKMKPRLVPNLEVKTKPHNFNFLRRGRNQLRLLNSPRLWLGLALLFCFLLCIFGPFKVLFDQDFLVQQIFKYQCCAVMAFVLIYTVLTIIGIPGTILTIAGGIAFGLSWGTFWSVVGATLGAIGSFWTARYLLHDSIDKRFGKHPALAKFKQAVKHKPLAFILAIRFAPISPFNIVNFLFGLTPIHWIPYALGTFIGIIPGTLAYTWLGVSGSQALQGGDRLPFFLALGFLSFLSILPICTYKKSRNFKF